MKKKKSILGICIVFAVILLVIVLCLIFKKDEDPLTLKSVKKATEVDSEFKREQYTNLVFHDFEVAVSQVEEVYNIEIETNKSYLDNTFLENFEIMSKVMDDFFKEDFDKSYIEADFYPPEGDAIYISFDKIKEQCTDEVYNDEAPTYLFGNNTADGGYMVQIDEALRNVWFSKYGMGDISSSQDKYKKVYPYLSGKRQMEDVEINLKDGATTLSEMEKKALSYLNDSFPLETSQGIDFAISKAIVLENGEYEGLCFKARRVYKEIPFEGGFGGGSGIYVDEFNSDSGEISYAESTSPDTMMGFGKVDGTIVETETITEMLTIDGALKLLSQKIGENSVYDVYGIELVYRECVTREEVPEGLDAVLKPMWKIITVNQNDDKYTLFYVDVVTGDITERFEYYYE